MKQTIIFLGVITVLFLGNFAVARAQATGVPYWGPLVSCTGGDPYTYKDSGGKDVTLPTCTSLCDTFFTAKNIIYFLMTIALFILAPIFFMWGGYKILTAGGDPGKAKEGREILLRVVIGVAVALLAFVIVKTVLDIFSLNGIVQGFDGKPITCTIQQPPTTP